MGIVAESPAHSTAKEISELVRRTLLDGGRGDTARLTLTGAYLRAWRRFTNLERVAALGAGEESVILARSLLSLVARSLWVAMPAGPGIREERWKRYAKAYLLDRIKTIEEMKAAGFEVDEDVLKAEHAQLEPMTDAKKLPGDKDLLMALNLGAFYPRLYRLGSDYAHFSLGLAIGELQDTEEVHFEKDDSELADEALRLATLTYGVFLQLSDEVLAHGLGDRVRRIIAASPAFAGDA
jgi:hypothetical protein